MLESTPNDLLRALSREALLRKPSPDLSEVEKTGRTLPIRWRGSNLELLGMGDWAGRISSKHSVVIGDSSVVAKVPLGELSRDCQEVARERLNISRLFADVSPPTMIIVAADDEGRAKPVVIQQRLHGRPACETPLRKLLRSDTLVSMKQILMKIYDVFIKTNLLDPMGQHFAKGLLAKVVWLHPFYSDNLFVGDNGKAYLVDNIPDGIANRYPEKFRKKLNFRLGLVTQSLNLLISGGRFVEWVKLFRLTSGSLARYNSSKDGKEILVRVK